MSMSALTEVAKGAFARTESTFRNIIGTSPSFPPEKNRYLLVAAHACPWANRCIMARSLFGLEQAVPMAVVHPTWAATNPNVDDHFGWVFSSPSDPPIQHPSGENEVACDEQCIPPPSHLNWPSARSVYDTSAPGATTKFTVPILYDLVENVIVNNESSEILRMLYDRDLLGQFATKNHALNLYPKEKSIEIETCNDFIYPSINNGVYKCGFAHSQAAYEAAAVSLKEGLQRVETILSASNFLCGDVLTEGLFNTYFFLETFQFYTCCGVSDFFSLFFYFLSLFSFFQLTFVCLLL